MRKTKQEVTTTGGTAFKTGLFATLGVGLAGVIVPIVVILALLFLCCGCASFGSVLPGGSSYSSGY